MKLQRLWPRRQPAPDQDFGIILGPLWGVRFQSTSGMLSTDWIHRLLFKAQAESKYRQYLVVAIEQLISGILRHRTLHRTTDA